MCSATLLTLTSTLRSFQTRSCKPRKSPVSFDMSVRPQLSARLQLDGFPYDLMMRTLTKIYREDPCLVNMGQKNIGAHYTKCDSNWWQQSV